MFCLARCIGCLAFLLAVVTCTMASAQGLLDRLEKRLEGVIGGDERTAPAPTEVAREPGYLGLVGDDKEESGRGVRVLTVREGGPAALAGVREGDLVVAVNGAAVTSLDDMDRRLAGKIAGSKVDLKIERAGKTQVVTAILGRRTVPLAPEAARGSDDLPAPRLPAEEPLPEEPRLAPASRASLGVTVAPVTDDARRRYGLGVRQGALISSVAAGSAADRAGLPVGGVVVAAEGRRIDHPDDLISLVRAMRPGEDLMLSYYQGATLYRKTVRLGEAQAEARVVFPDEPRGDAPRDSDRPLLRRLERALDAVVPPDRPAGIPFAPAEPPGGDLRTEVERLRARIDELERRLVELEGRLESKRPQPAAEESLELELKPPAEPPPALK